MTVLEKEWLRRLMIRYFMMQNITDFDEKVYPPDLMDLPMQVPELIDKIEIVPYSINADPNWGLVKTGWNLFILGNQRMDLGYTYHTSPMVVRSLARCRLSIQLKKSSISSSTRSQMRENSTSHPEVPAQFIPTQWYRRADQRSARR